VKPIVKKDHTTSFWRYFSLKEAKIMLALKQVRAPNSMDVNIYIPHLHPWLQIFQPALVRP
jgi:hypothetical protein